MKRRVLPIVAWLVATVASVLLATAAVGNVGSWGTDQPTALQTTTAGVVTVAPSSTAAPAASVLDSVPSTTTVPSTSAPPAVTTTASPAAASTTAAPSSTTAPSQPPATTQPPAPSTTSTSTTTTVAPPSEEYFESRQLIGGWVQLRINGDDVHLEAAVAEPGFTIDVEHNGPERVEVEFKSESHDSKLTARVHEGELDIRTEEEPEDD